jgi:hypothetical protein
VPNDAIAPELITAIRQTVVDAVRTAGEPGYFDAAASARYLSVSLRTFDSVSHDIPCHRLSAGGKRLYARTNLDAFMQRHLQAKSE